LITGAHDFVDTVTFTLPDRAPGRLAVIVAVPACAPASICPGVETVATARLTIARFMTPTLPGSPKATEHAERLCPPAASSMRRPTPSGGLPRAGAPGAFAGCAGRALTRVGSPLGQGDRGRGRQDRQIQVSVDFDAKLRERIKALLTPELIAAPAAMNST
jgi:hypothetical protein